MPAREAGRAKCEVRGAQGDLRTQRTPHPAPRTPHGFTYCQVVERLERAGVESAALDAACVLEAASGIARWRVILEPERAIPRESAGLVARMLARREAREPLAYILGVKEFWSLSLAVSPDVLIPRPETESVVEAVLEKISSEFRVPSSGCETASSRLAAGSVNPKPETRNPKLRILDIGTGCGAIALALAMELPRGLVLALDCSPAALRIAQRNATALGLAGRVHLIGGDLFRSLREARAGRGFDVIVSNPPYIPSDALASLPPEISAYEPREALDGGADGLRYHRWIIEQAPGHLKAGAWLVLEVGDGQSGAVVELVQERNAFGPAEVKKDLAGRDRVVVARRRDVIDG